VLTSVINTVIHTDRLIEITLYTQFEVKQLPQWLKVKTQNPFTDAFRNKQPSNHKLDLALEGSGMNFFIFPLILA
jgi:hypothetical protein